MNFEIFFDCFELNNFNIYIYSTLFMEKKYINLFLSHAKEFIYLSFKIFSSCFVRFLIKYQSVEINQPDIYKLFNKLCSFHLCIQIENNLSRLEGRFLNVQLLFYKLLTNLSRMLFWFFICSTHFLNFFSAVIH